MSRTMLEGVGISVDASRSRSCRDRALCIRDEARLLQPALALRALADVGLEGSNAKTLLAIEEEVDLGREQVSMVHGGSYGAG